MFTRTLVTLALVCLCGRGFAQEEEQRPVWEEEAMLLYSDSSSEFSRLRSLGGRNERLDRYTRALDALHDESQDVEERHTFAREMLESLVDEMPNDAIAMGSRYYLARIAQVHPFEEDLQKAKLLYLDLFEQFPSRFFGQMALLKYITIEIYDESAEGADASERLRNVEELGAGITRPEIRRNFHRMLGEAYHAFDLDPGKAYDHLKEAYDIGIPIVSMKIDVLAKLAELSEDFGDWESAHRAYSELAELSQLDERHEHFARKAREMEQRRDSLPVN